MDKDSVSAPAYGHVHTSLASARFNVDDAVWSEIRTECTWAIYMDNSLSRWEVFVDAEHGRVFTSEETWDSLDGEAQVAFTNDFVRAYKGTNRRELRVLTDAVYQSSARARAQAAGTAHVAPEDRLRDLQRRAQEAVVAAAGVSRARSASQLQVLAQRHAALVEDLAVLEAELGRARSAVALAGSALHSALG